MNPNRLSRPYASRRAPRWLIRIFAGLLRCYPHSFYREFKDEMLLVFSQSLDRAASESAASLARFACREIFPLPALIAREHLLAIKSGHDRRQASSLSNSAVGQSPSSLKDGRHSLVAALLEISVFLITSIWLLLEAYYPAAIQPELRSQRPELLSPLILLFILPLAAVGLLRGLPRWAFPPAGFLLGYSFTAARAFHLLPLWFLTAASFVVLAFAAWKVNARWPLPDKVRLLASQLRRDWTSFSFAAYGLAPLMIHAAFHDGFPRGSTPYLALAVLVMLAGAGLFARSSKAGPQVTALISGISIPIWLVLPHKILSPVPLPAALLRADLAWLSAVWSAALLLLALPGILNLIRPPAAPESASG